MAIHPNSLANLRSAKKGEVLNPKGENGATKSREREALILRTLNSLEELEDEELRQEALEAVTHLVTDRALQGGSRSILRGH